VSAGVCENYDEKKCKFDVIDTIARADRMLL